MSRQQQLEGVARDIIENKVCPELAASATQLVLGEGSTHAAIMVVGEAPGATEDREGRPFAGASGRVLSEMFDSIGLSREDVYITNIVKYRPPKNRDPKPDEIDAFKPYLQQQINIIKPQIIITLGRHAMNVFLPGAKIGEIHGQPQMVDGHWYLPLYHPAAALYNGGMRVTLKEDFSRIPDILENL